MWDIRAAQGRSRSEGEASGDGVYGRGVTRGRVLVGPSDYAPREGVENKVPQRV